MLPIQTVVGTGVFAASITTPAFANAVVVGHTLLAQCANTLNANGSTFTFSDAKSNTWVVDAAINIFQSGQHGVYAGQGRAPITTGGTSETVSATLGATSIGYQLTAQEWAEILVVDKTATGTGAVSTTSITCTTAATTQPSDLLVGVFAGETSTTATGVSDPASVNGSTTGVTSLEVVSATTTCSCEMSYKVLTATGTQAMAWTYSADATGGYAATAVAYIVPQVFRPPFTQYCQPALLAQ